MHIKYYNYNVVKLTNESYKTKPKTSCIARIEQKHFGSQNFNSTYQAHYLTKFRYNYISMLRGTRSTQSWQKLKKRDDEFFTYLRCSALFTHVQALKLSRSSPMLVS